MKKILAILQLIIGIVVVLFAFTMFWHALSAIFSPISDIYNPSRFPILLNPLYEWPQLILSLFIMFVVAIYTKNVFDKLSVND